MEIICDTNIWYSLADGTIPEEDLNPTNKYIVTFNSLDEITKTYNLINNPELVRTTIQKMFDYSKDHAIFAPPVIYLKLIGLPGYKYDVLSHHSQIVYFTQLFAQGHSIDINKIDQFKEIINARKTKLLEIANFFNDRAKIIKSNIKDKNKHRKIDSTHINREFINKIVLHQTDTEGLPANFDWGLIELFEKTLKVFLNELETGAMPFRDNDVYDLLLLVYVNPYRKLWTREKTWIRLIKSANMTKYLYEG